MAQDVIVKFDVKSDAYENKLKRATSSLQEMTDKAQQQGRAIATANEKNIEFARSLGSMQTVATSVRGKMNELTTAFENAAHSYNRLSAAEKNSSFGRALKGSVDQLATRIKNLRQEMATTQSQLGKTGGMGIGAQFGQGLSSAAAMFGPAALAIGGVTAAVSGMKKVMGDMIQINMQFEQGSANLAAVLGTSRSEITALTEQAKQLGATTQYTANQILELQANLARLGFNQNEILNSTKSVQAMATAMGADLGEAANLAGSALRGFGLNATEMERVASVLSVATTKSALSFEKLATALPVVQTAASKTGFTIEDTVAMLGKLTDNGINAASAATQLRKILNDSTTAGTKLANALGGPVKNFEELVAALNKASKAGQNHADSVALVNSKNATALDILRDMSVQREVEINGVKEQTSSLQELRDSITDCADGMKAMQDEQLNTLQGSITILNSAWEGLMLTFSESNGTIKKVVDSLTNLLTAYTNWRKRNQGGDAAISTYELGLTDESKKEADAFIEEQKASGKTAKSIVADANEKIAAMEKELKTIEDLEKAYKEYEKNLKTAQNSGNVEAAVNMMDSNPLKGTNYMGKGKSFDNIYKDAAKLRDSISQQNYIVTTLTPSTQTVDPNEDGKEEEKSKKQLQILKAQYEEQEKAQIAALDRMAMNEADYEAEVYRIKRETLQKIADLYQDETAEKARANAALSQLDIQYQGTQMRLANKGSKKTKTYAQQTGPSGYSQEGISALRSEIQGGMKSMQMGSAEYMVEADRLADLASFENLLKAAVQAGIQIDPTILEENFENIDLGVDIPDDQWESLVEQINKQLEALDLPPIELDVKTGGVKKLNKEVEGTIDHVSGAAAAFQALGDAMSNIDDPGAQVAGLIAQAIGSVVAGYGTATAQAATMGPWAWIAFAITGLATMISMVAGIKSATAGSYASGGMVPGTSFSGDNTIIAANAGEVVLNRAQQTNLASQLEAGSLPNNLHLSTDVSGTNLRIVLDNDNRSKGGSRGHYSRTH